jgi:apolipoprotein N-acyltransferase
MDWLKRTRSLLLGDAASKWPPLLWLLAGLALLPFTFFQTVIPLAGWLAPIFLLRFERTSPWRGRYTLLAIRLACVAALLAASRGLPFSLPGFLGNVLLKGVIWSLPYTLDLALSRRLRGWVRTLIFPLAFTAVDWLISLTPISSSGSPAYSQAGFLALVQIVSITGMWGITFLIGWCAALVNAGWEAHFSWPRMRGQALAFIGVLAAALLYGVLRLNLPAPAVPAIPAAAITIDPTLVDQATRQIDWTTFYRAGDAERAALRPSLAVTVDQMLARTETALRAGAKIAAWQESGAWTLEEDRSAVIARAGALAARYHATLQISLEVFTHNANMRVLRNQSILIDPSGRVQWTYDKTYPVPYDEAFVTLPGAGILPLAESPAGRLSGAICYDTYFPALIRQAGQKGTDLFFAPANDVPQFAASALDMAAYRAVENGFTLLRPTGKGISAVIDPLGRVLARQDAFTNPGGILLAGVPARGVTTVYSRIGDLFAHLCAAGTACLAGLALLHRKQPARVSVSQPEI